MNWTRIARVWKEIADDWTDAGPRQSKSGLPGICCNIGRYLDQLSYDEYTFMNAAIADERERRRKRYKNSSTFWVYVWNRNKTGNRARVAFCLRQMKKALDQAEKVNNDRRAVRPSRATSVSRRTRKETS